MHKSIDRYLERVREERGNEVEQRTQVGFKNTKVTYYIFDAELILGFQDNLIR